MIPVERNKYRWALVVVLAGLPWLLIYLSINCSPPDCILITLLYYWPVAHFFYSFISWWNWKCAGIYAGIVLAPYGFSGGEALGYGVIYLMAIVVGWFIARALQALHLRGYV
jgi:hypothetical protein